MIIGAIILIAGFGLMLWGVFKLKPTMPTEEAQRLSQRGYGG